MAAPVPHQAVPPIFSAYGAALALHQIVNRGALVAGDLHVIEIASALLFKASSEGRL